MKTSQIFDFSVGHLNSNDDIYLIPGGGGNGAWTMDKQESHVWFSFKGTWE